MKRSLYRQVGKRVLDVVLVAAASPLLLPLFVLLAAAVKLTSRGPVFYRQVRAGRHGDLFDLLKFRSMVVGAERMGAGVRVEPNDARITAVGRLLRRFSLDEIPQIVNVVRGQMSLIGPRPALPYPVAQYTSAQRRRLEVRPGLTGWAQVNGRNVINW
ncbi:MAG: sugar transferase [Acidobacteriota bacterium]